MALLKSPLQKKKKKSPLQSGCNDQQTTENQPTNCKAIAAIQSNVARIAHRVFLKTKWEFSQKPLDHIPQRMIFLWMIWEFNSEHVTNEY